MVKLVGPCGDDGDEEEGISLLCTVPFSWGRGNQRGQDARLIERVDPSPPCGFFGGACGACAIVANVVDASSGAFASSVTDTCRKRVGTAAEGTTVGLKAVPAGTHCCGPIDCEEL